MNTKLLLETHDAIEQLELAAMNYAWCKLPGINRCNTTITEKEDALLALFDKLVNANAKTKRKAARCKAIRKSLSIEVDCLEDVIEMLEERLRETDDKLDATRSALALLSPIANAWEEGDEWYDGTVWHAYTYRDDNTKEKQMTIGEVEKLVLNQEAGWRAYSRDHIKQNYGEAGNLLVYIITIETQKYSALGRAAFWRERTEELVAACQKAYSVIKLLPIEALGVGSGGGVGIGGGVTNWSIRDELLCNLEDAIDKARKEVT